MNREPCKHGIVGHEDCETIEIERLEAALSAAESQLKAYAAQIYAADGFSGEHWRRVAKELEKERDASVNACTGDLANMRARVEALTAELATAHEAKRLALDEAAGAHRAADLAEAELERVKAEREEFKRIGQGFERDSRKFFEQSCKNLERAEAAEAEVKKLREALTHYANKRNWFYSHLGQGHYGYRGGIAQPWRGAEEALNPPPNATPRAGPVTQPDAPPTVWTATLENRVHVDLPGARAAKAVKVPPQVLAELDAVGPLVAAVADYEGDLEEDEKLIQRVRAETWEEAAKVLEAEMPPAGVFTGGCDKHCTRKLIRIAAALRARGGGK